MGNGTNIVVQNAECTNGLIKQSEAIVQSQKHPIFATELAMLQCQLQEVAIIKGDIMITQEELEELANEISEEQFKETESKE